MKEKLIIGIDIGGTNFRIGAVDRKNRVLNFSRRPVSSVLKGGDAIKELATFIEEYMRELGGEAGAVAIGFPAPLDKARKTVLKAPNLPRLENLPVSDELERILGIPVFIERDVNMLLAYDMKKYGLPDTGVVCAFYFGTGIGNAIFINGRPYIGRKGAAGELGHIPVDGSDELCGCGLRGCMENLAGGKYLARLRQESYPDTPIEELFTRHGEEPLLQQFVDRMAQAVSTELTILDPDYVLIGGGVPAMKAFPREKLNERIAAHTKNAFSTEEFEALHVEENEEKGVLGAAIYCRGKID